MLTVGAVAAGVIVIIFLTALFFGIRTKLTNMLTESIPHVTVKVRETEPVPLEVQDLESAMSSSRIEKQAPQLKFIDDWRHVVDMIRTIPNVRVVLPAFRDRVLPPKEAIPLA